MLINEVCKECNLTKKAVEYYTEQGLIQPRITENGYRQFSETDALKLKRIAVLRGLGFSVPEIRTILENDSRTAIYDVLKFTMSSTGKSLKSSSCKQSRH